MQRERNGEVIDRVLMKNCLSMLVEVNVSSTEVYVEDFERDFLVETRNFYQKESQEFMNQNTVPDYLRKVGKLRCCPRITWLTTIFSYAYRLRIAFAKKKTALIAISTALPNRNCAMSFRRSSLPNMPSAWSRSALRALVFLLVVCFCHWSHNVSL